MSWNCRSRDHLPTRHRPQSRRSLAHRPDSRPDRRWDSGCRGCPSRSRRRWPFCWWVLVVVDHVSRAVLGFEIYRDTPYFREVQASVDRIFQRVGRHPRYVITDKGGQFRNASWRTWSGAREESAHDTERSASWQHRHRRAIHPRDEDRVHVEDSSAAGRRHNGA